jgi:hypothetical protein
MLELNTKGKKYKLTKTGIAFKTKIRKTRGSLFHTIPKEVCLGCELKKGQDLLNYLVYYGKDKIGLFIPLKDDEEI